MLGQTSTHHQMSDRTRQCGAQASCQMNKQKEHWELQSSALNAYHADLRRCFFSSISHIWSRSQYGIFFYTHLTPLGILATVCKSWSAKLVLKDVPGHWYLPQIPLYPGCLYSALVICPLEKCPATTSRCQIAPVWKCCVSSREKASRIWGGSSIWGKYQHPISSPHI